MLFFRVIPTAKGWPNFTIHFKGELPADFSPLGLGSPGSARQARLAGLGPPVDQNSETNKPEWESSAE